ncbi:MAG: hypothetical protein ACRDHN_16230, partial [Thermomicrobiales bacterium]
MNRSSPVAELSPGSKRALILLVLLGLGKALALVGIATAMASGIVSVIDGSNEWKSALWLGGGSALLRAAIAWA